MHDPCFTNPRCIILASLVNYRKIPKISPGAYIFQRPFLSGLFLEGLIFGGAYLRREICVSKSIGLALKLEVNLPFLFWFTLYLRAIFQVQAPGGLFLEGRFNGGFFALPDLGAYTWRGLFSEFYGIPFSFAKMGPFHFFLWAPLGFRTWKNFLNKNSWILDNQI